MVGIKVLSIDFLKKVNSYLFFSEILNSYLEKLIPTYLLVKSLIPSLKNRGQLSASHRNNQRRIWISRLQNSGEPTCQIKYWETKIMNSIGLEWLKHSETWKRLVHCHTDFQTCSKSIVEPAQTGSIRFATVAYSKNMMNTTDRYLFSIFKSAFGGKGLERLRRQRVKGGGY